MGKWLNKILKPTDSAESKHHPDLEDLALLVEGRRAGAERKRILRHLNRCGKCYEILQETLKDTHATTKAKTNPVIWWKRKSVYAVAASILMILILGGQLIDKYRTQPSRIFSVKLTLDQELKEILLENNDLQWKNSARIERLLSALNKKGFQLKHFNHVVLSKPYYQTKSPFGPREILHIRIEDDVAYLEIHEILKR
ncbi:MAG: hypothetical protein PVI00_04440 [Desulfobacterales bacterium]|jgi:hypothetical protein